MVIIMEFKYKYFENPPNTLDDYLEAYCCENEVKITLTSSERRSSELIIQKMPNAREDIDIADCFMEFLLFLNKENREFYTIDKIKFIRFLNMTIKPEFINIILSLCAISHEDYYKDKCVEFGTCFIPKELKLGSLPCKGASIVISNCIIEDFQSLNGFNGDYLSIFNSNIENYTGSVNMNCSKVNICDTPMNYPYFFLNWGSEAGAFGFSDSLPFMGPVWWILILLAFLIIVGFVYLLIADAIRRRFNRKLGPVE